MARFEGPIQADLYGEVAISLGQQSMRLRAALDALRKHDAVVVDPVKRVELLEVAAERLWGLVVQRELLGLIDSEYIRTAYAVPRDVWLKMGPRVRR